MAGSIYVSDTTTLKLKTYSAGLTPSNTVTAVYTIAERVARPVLTPTGGSFSGAITVTASTTTAGAILRYTLSGEDPTEQSPAVSGGISITASALLKVRAFRSGWRPSDVMAASYEIAGVEPPSVPSIGSPMVLKLGGILSDTRFNATSAQIVVGVSSGAIGTQHPQTIYLNGALLPTNNLVVQSQSVSVVGMALVPGFNRIDATLTDVDGLTASRTFDLWAGTRTVAITVRDSTGAIPVAGSTVDYSLGDAWNVNGRVSVTNGQAILTSVPPVTVAIRVGIPKTSSRPAEKLIAIVANQSTMTVQTPVPAPANSTNLDFSQGLSGWQTGPGVTVIAAQAFDTVSVAPASQLYTRVLPRVSAGGFDTATRVRSPHFLNSPPVSYDFPVASPLGTRNLQVHTSGLPGTRFARSRIVTAPGTSRLRLKYRYNTQEVPGGYFGSPYDDYYAVSATSSFGADRDINSMNALGLGAFDAAGWTDWREISVETNVQGDLVDVSFEVTNVLDGAFDAMLVVSAVQETRLGFSITDLRDIDNGPLLALSASPHTYYGGLTIIHGRLELAGPTGASLDDVRLEVFEGTRLVATGTLAAAARTALLGSFPASGRRATGTTVGRLFEITSAQFSAVAQDFGATLSYRLVARSGTQVAQTQLRSIVKVVLSPVQFRYGTRDPGDCVGTVPPYRCGGDDWVQSVAKADAIALSGVVGFRWNDYSNMNGGTFPPHGSHTLGLDIDGRFETDSAYRLSLSSSTGAATTVARLVAAINQMNALPLTYARVQTVFVVVTPQIRAALQGVVLNDGRPAASVIVHDSSHVDHFHFRFFQ